MLEDVSRNFALTKFPSIVSGKLREVLDNATTTIDKKILKGFQAKKCESGDVALMPKTVM